MTVKNHGPEDVSQLFRFISNSVLWYTCDSGFGVVWTRLGEKEWSRFYVVRIRGRNENGRRIKAIQVTPKKIFVPISNDIR
jgi:hypothetical protein